MGYTMRNGRYANTADVTLNPLEGAALTVDGKSQVVELGDRGVLRLRLLCTSVSAADTLDVTVETSRDGVTWYSAGTFTQVTDAAQQDQRKVFAVDRFVRADFNVGGTGVSIACTLTGEAT